MNLVNIVVDVPLNRQFTYSVATNLVVGTRVIVEFKRKNVVGFVWQNDLKASDLDCDISKVKPVAEILPEVLEQQTFDLVAFIAKYYHYPIGQTLFSCLPPHLRKTKVISRRKMKTSISKNVVKDKLILNIEQQAVVDQVSLHLASFYPSILYGITGSGKTEVYLELIDKVLLNGQQVLVLVPEINLTPQLLDRFSKRFASNILQVLTSHASERSREIGYFEALSGEKSIIIGTRLAIFTPFRNLGLIIVDEEHDQSFKQNEGLRYSARDLAVWRANYAKVPIILGSATPSLETLYNYKLKKYALYKLSVRAVNNSWLPQINLIDLNTTTMINGLSDKVIFAIKQRLLHHELSLVFINRRGYSPIVTCYDCGWVSSCLQCSTNLVYHSATKQLKCHHCGFSIQIPKSCPKCDNQYLHTVGHGTQKIEEQLYLAFPEARICRIDQDTTSGKDQWDELYSKINNYEVDILVGTQMLAKGHDFPHLTLVVGLNIDSGLYSHDFRSSELLFTQLTQVAGRAGRGGKPGLVLLQTHYPQHELYQYLVKHDFAGFANYLLKQRKLLKLPPYAHYSILRASGYELSLVLEYLTKIYQVALKIKPSQVMLYPPVPAILQKLKNRERGQMLIMSENREILHGFLSTLVMQIDKIKIKHDISWLLDIDPLEQ